MPPGAGQTGSKTGAPFPVKTRNAGLYEWVKAGAGLFVHRVQRYLGRAWQ
jgi:hypothetical protein